MKDKNILLLTFYGFLMYFIGLVNGLSRQSLMLILLFLILVGGFNLYLYFKNKGYLKG